MNERTHKHEHTVSLLQCENCEVCLVSVCVKNSLLEDRAQSQRNRVKTGIQNQNSADKSG